MDIKNTRIAAQLHEIFDQYVDISDVKDDGKKEPCFLTRALSALALRMLTEISPNTAADAVVDGFNDLGIDAVYIDENTQRLIIVQSKWMSSSNSAPDTGSIHKVIAGVDALINLQFSGANEKIIRKASSIESAMKKMGGHVEVVIVYTGNQKASPDVTRILDTFMNKIDDGTKEIIDYCLFSQSDVYKFLSDGQNGYEINCEDLVIYNWGKLDEPNSVYYGTISANLLAEWYAEHDQRLFDKNIRYYRGSTEVNEGIIKVLKEEPENFFYYNNGIKAICKNITRKAIGSTDNKTGIFCAHGISIVNGAQTTGAIYAASLESPDKVGHARVLAQFISLEGTTPSFADQVTKLSNTQNRIDNKDFVALDETQDRLKRELQFSHVEYLYKAGSDITDRSSQCSFDEALVSLACFQEDLSYVATVKRNVGALVADVTKAPYTVLFNGNTSSNQIWNLVRIARRVDQTVKQNEAQYQGKDRLVLVHGNRVILHRVYQSIQDEGTNLSNIISDTEINALVLDKLDSIIYYIQQKFSEVFQDSYPANVFKNVGKIRELFM